MPATPPKPKLIFSPVERYITVIFSDGTPSPKIFSKLQAMQILSIAIKSGKIRQAEAVKLTKSIFSSDFLPLACFEIIPIFLKLEDPEARNYLN